MTQASADHIMDEDGTDSGVEMDTKTLKSSSILSNEGAAELYAAFRTRVAEKAGAVIAVVDAFSRQDPEAFMSSASPEIGDGAFDAALNEAHKRGEIEADLYHGLMYSLLEAASYSSEHDPDGHSFTVTELFALPVSGTIEEILEVTGSFEGLSRIASVFSSTGYVAEGVQVILSPTTIDPISATRLSTAIARELAEAFVPHFEHGYSPEDAEDLFECVQPAFEYLGDGDRDHLSEHGRVTRLVIGATRRIHSTRYPTQADAFIANFMDENDSERLQEVSDAFLDRLNSEAPGSITYNWPLPITRAAAFSAVSAVVEGLNDEAMALGIRRPDFLMEEMSISRHGDRTAVEGVLGERILGPVMVPDALLQRDRLWFRNSLSRLCDEIHERDHMITPQRRLN
jgi:hypothetical protein